MRAIKTAECWVRRGVCQHVTRFARHEALTAKRYNRETDHTEPSACVGFGSESPLAHHVGPPLTRVWASLVAQMLRKAKTGSDLCLLFHNSSDFPAKIFEGEIPQCIRIICSKFHLFGLTCVLTCVESAGSGTGTLGPTEPVPWKCLNTVCQSAF